MDLMLIIFFVGLLMVVSGLLVKKLQNMFMTEPLLAMLAGVLLGPVLLNIIAADQSPEKHYILELAAKLTIAMALMATAMRIPQGFYKSNKTTLNAIIILGMILMWLLSSAVLYFVLQEFTFFECLLFGAIITPTDPVVASTIVTGDKAKKYLPKSIRNTLSFEAGINDGLAFPIVMLSVFLVTRDQFPISEWVFKTVLFENVLAAIIAFGIGYISGLLMHKSHKVGFMNSKAVLAFSLALTFVLLSGLEIVKMNGIIGVFIGGLAFRFHIQKNEEIQEERVQEAMERLFTIPVFFILGLLIPWQEWVSMGWSAVFICIFILLLRRIPAFFILKPIMPNFKRKNKDLLIMGWFGPIGVAAIFYALMVKEKTGLEDAWIIGSLIVFFSTILHGITSIPFERWYHKRTASKK